jgi:phosphatidylinositol alpha-1,6-mannosyltransferase
MDRTIRRRVTEILGLFPAFDSERFGGIQMSGRDAWKSVVDGFGEASAHILFYKQGEFKGTTVFSALRSPRAKRILVWHLQLARLVPLVATTQSRVTVFLHGIEAWRRLDYLTRAALRRVHLFVSNSDFTWARFVEFNPEFAEAAHQTVHLGFGTISNDARTANGSPPAVLMVGRLLRSENYKGHKELIGAWPLLVRSLPNAELWIAGDGDLRPELEQLARSLGVQGRVRFYGHISEFEKEQLIEQCRCLAMPSTGEGFGLVYLEAMRMGRPCLVSTLDAGQEVVNPPEAGLAVDPSDSAAMASALVRLLTLGPEWTAWSDQSRRRYATKFTREHFQERLTSALAGWP